MPHPTKLQKGAKYEWYNRILTYSHKTELPDSEYSFTFRTETGFSQVLTRSEVGRIFAVSTK